MGMAGRGRKRTALDRSQIMARIGGKDTAPEMRLRRALRASGIGYRLHARDLPGRPDIVFRGARLAVFVHGCFWHRHPGCRKATDPKSNADFWREKFRRNVERDRRSLDLLMAAGWSVGVVWECELSHDGDVAAAVAAVAEALGRETSDGNGMDQPLALGDEAGGEEEGAGLAEGPGFAQDQIAGDLRPGPTGTCAYVRENGAREHVQGGA